MKGRICVLALLDTLEYLEKGGRLSKTAALAGKLFGIKPVVAFENGEIVVLGKARGSKSANNLLVENINRKGDVDFHLPLLLGYTGLTDTLLHKYIIDSRALWETRMDTLPIVSIGGTIGTHAGPGAIAAAFFTRG